MPAAQVLLRVAETVCGPQARHVVFDALVADLDREWRDTRGVGRIALVFTGALAYLRSIFLCIDVTHAMAVMPRVTWSVEPPAAHGTMMVIGLVGFHSAEAGMANDSAAPAAAAYNARLIIGIPPKTIGALFDVPPIGPKHCAVPWPRSRDL